MDFLMQEFRDKIINSFNKYNVEYKMVGGAVICLINPKRETIDLDFEIKSGIENLIKIVDALIDCKFATSDDLKVLFEDRYSEEDAIPNNVQLYPSLPGWDMNGFHIDICESLSGITYDDLGEEIYEDNGIKIVIAPFKDILRMKENVGNLWSDEKNPRDKDIQDIEFLCKKFGFESVYYINPYKKSTKSRLIDVFTRKKRK